jgi:hypothetical protein
MGFLAAVSACNKSGGSSGDATALIPRDAQGVVAVNADRLRGSKLWASVNEIKNDTKTKQDYDEFVRKTGLDPLTQLNALVAGFNPGPSNKSFVLVIKGKFDEKRIIDYVKEKQKSEGQGELKTESYGGKTLYGSTTDSDMQAVFLDGSTVALGGKEWLHKVVDLSGGRGESVRKNSTVDALLKKARTDQGIWGVASLPPDAVPAEAGVQVKSLVINADFADGFKADVLAEAPNADGAKKLSTQLQDHLGKAKQDPQAAMMMAMSGLGALVDSAKISTDGNWSHVTLSMTQTQLDELTNRIKGMIKMMQSMGGMGGLAGPPGGVPPGGAMPVPVPPPPAPSTPKK